MVANLAQALTELSGLSGTELSPVVTRVLMRVVSELHEELADQVTRQDMAELRAVVADLAAAQQRTEQRLEALTLRVDALAQAQERTEQRLEALTLRVDALAQAQERTEQRVDALARAQERTEREVATLARAMRQVQQELGGLSHAVGYRLEDDAYLGLPRLLTERHGLRVVEPLRRAFLTLGGRRTQVNLWGLAERADGARVRLVGEAKSQLGPKHMTGVSRLVDRTRPLWEAPEALVVLVTYMAEPEALEEATARGWLVLHSWELRTA